MLHGNAIPSDGIHVVQSWEVADAAARLALVLVAADVGKVCRQLDTNKFYILENHSPVTWQGLGGDLIEQSGTFVPTLYGSTIPGVHTYATQTGFWRRTGSIVHFTLFIILSVKDVAMAGDVRIGDLPFTVIPLGHGAVSIGFVTFTELSTAKIAWMGLALAGTKYISMREAGNNNGLTSLPAANITDNTGFIISGTYFTSD